MTDRPQIDDESATPPQGDELLDGAQHQAVSGRAAAGAHVDDEGGTPPHGDELLEGAPHE
ncbi:hypothetical protein [Capillimicrobium parvum]|uniref:Uncharacterized protein n=1 Tax=Capillimicrobium parvum TaxID=2884022 RepID=A0A9E6XXU7_9ACTN|nr:hypothetical protein [Capillimicrobium parvum]UGS36220.1 hypothetical protein DSM104329_02620 [Capillimicrobium parvum]